MARKSRKNMMPQAAVQEAVQQNEKELLRTAAYARLSVENGGHETEDSLHTQILQIHNYIRENPELTLTDTYADNGFTGTRFDRPEFERMMQDVRTGKIQCIVVKDLSRFGRDYIETGSYLETIFPMVSYSSMLSRLAAMAGREVGSLISMVLRDFLSIQFRSALVYGTSG